MTADRACWVIGTDKDHKELRGPRRPTLSLALDGFLESAKRKGFVCVALKGEVTEIIDLTPGWRKSCGSPKEPPQIPTPADPIL